MTSYDRKASQASDRTSLLLKGETSKSKSSTFSSIGLPSLYGGNRGHPPHHQRSVLETQKQQWALTDRRLFRLRWISALQIVFGIASLWNFQWATNLFTPFVGFVGMLAVWMEQLSWTIVYVMVSLLEFARNILLAQVLYARYLIPNFNFTYYEYYQIVFMVIETIVLIPLAFHAILTAPAPYKRYYIPR